MHLCPDQNPLRHVCQKRSQVIDAYQRPRVHGVDNPAWPQKGFKRQLPGCFAVPVVMQGGVRMRSGMWREGDFADFDRTGGADGPAPAMLVGCVARRSEGHTSERTYRMS